MTASIKHSGKAGSVPGGIAVGVAVGMVTTLMLSLAIALLLNAERITWLQAGYWIMAMLFLTSFLGAKCAYAWIKHQRLLVSVMTGLMYWALLLCFTALFFGGQFGAVLETAGIIGAGSGTAALITMPNPAKYRKKPGRAYR